MARSDHFQRRLPLRSGSQTRWAVLLSFAGPVTLRQSSDGENRIANIRGTSMLFRLES
jgi:hypothetical protein